MAGSGTPSGEFPPAQDAPLYPGVVQFRAVPQSKQLRNPISRKQVESVLAKSVAGFSLVFSLLTLQTLAGQWNDAQPSWAWAASFALLASVLLAIVASFTGRHVYAAHGSVAIAYVLALLSWPFTVVVPTTDLNHWLYLLLTVGTSTAAIAFATPWAATYLFAVPTLYGIIRATPAGGGAPLSQATLDAIYAIILGGAVLIITSMLRQAASSVDILQATALDRYGHAVRQHATEVERVQVDAIVHDSVLTTLLSAARAFTPESKALAATMAASAIDQLHEAALVTPDDGTTVRLRDVAMRIQDAAGRMSPPFELRSRDIGPRSMPIQAAEAIYSAAYQAMVNSLQHAGPAKSTRRWLSMRGTGLDGIQVEIGDTGDGFLMPAVPAERLGVRVSIIERVANAGGVAAIDSAPDEGTIVTIRWPSTDGSAGKSEEAIAEAMEDGRAKAAKAGAAGGSGGAGADADAHSSAATSGIPDSPGSSQSTAGEDSAPLPEAV